MELRAILRGLVVEHAPNVQAVVFCDEEGERVEAVARDPSQEGYDLDLIGAIYCSLARAIADEDAGIRVAYNDQVIHVRVLLRGYYVLAVAEKDGLQPCIERGLARVGDALIEHM